MFSEFEAREKGQRQIAVIEVPAQRDHDKPFIVDRLVDDDDQRITKAIGWPERSGDTTYWHPKERIQQLISSGLRAQRTEPAFSTPDGAEEDLAVAWEAAGVEEGVARVSLQLVPLEPTGGFSSFYGADAEALGQWRPVRLTGFGFDLGWHRPEPRGVRFVASDEQNALAVARTGTVTLVSSFFTRVFLWGSEPPNATLNPFALTEWLAEGVRLAYLFVGDRLHPMVGASSWKGVT